MAVIGDSSDPLDKSILIAGGSSLLCDGIWVWREDWAYFIKKYRLGLSRDFVEHVELNNTVKADITLSNRQVKKACELHSW